MPRVDTCANLVRKLCYSNKDHMMAGMIVAGWDPYKGGQVYEIPLGGTLVQQSYSIGGSGSSYIYGLMDAEYREGMTKEECKEFVKKCKRLDLSIHVILLLLFCNHSIWLLCLLAHFLSPSLLSLFLLFFLYLLSLSHINNNYYNRRVTCHGQRRILRRCGAIGGHRQVRYREGMHIRKRAAVYAVRGRGRQGRKGGEPEGGPSLPFAVLR